MAIFAVHKISHTPRFKPWSSCRTTTADRCRLAPGCSRSVLGLLMPASQRLPCTASVREPPSAYRSVAPLALSLSHANRRQKLDANDLFDFHHAEAALGYCDAFLTDGPMHSLLMQRHLGIESGFTCRVISSIEAAADWVRCRLA